MQDPFQDSFQNNPQCHPQNHFHSSPNFIPRNIHHVRPPPSHWRLPAKEYLNEFCCETCDRSFRTLDILEKHKQQHQKCNIDGCGFIAHPKVITKHIQMQHASGLYKKIAKLQDPEEIQKWREERKKKYPTKENVEKAAAAIKEKIARGEKMGLKYDRHRKNLNTGIADKRKPFENQKNHTTRVNINSGSINKKRKITAKNIDKKLPAVEDSRKLKPFLGIQDIVIDVDEPQELGCSFTIEDDDELTEASFPLKDSSGSVCHALSSLLCNYGSSDEECDKQTTITTHISGKLETQLLKGDVNKLIPQTKIESDDDCGPDEVKVTKEILLEVDSVKLEPVINKRKPKNDLPRKPVLKRPKLKMPSTLLHKLLFKEMQQERNIVLQCIRHIVKNNFFDKTV